MTTPAEAYYNKYGGKIVEIYFGDTSGKSKYSDNEVEHKSYMRGRLVAADGELLDLECEITTPEGTFKDIVTIFGWKISGMKEAKSNCSILDMFNLHKEREYRRVR